jgi:hypothetical protein
LPKSNQFHKRKFSARVIVVLDNKVSKTAKIRRTTNPQAPSITHSFELVDNWSVYIVMLFPADGEDGAWNDQFISFYGNRNGFMKLCTYSPAVCSERIGCNCGRRNHATNRQLVGRTNIHKDFS